MNEATGPAAQLITVVMLAHTGGTTAVVSCLPSRTVFQPLQFFFQLARFHLCFPCALALALLVFLPASAFCIGCVCGSGGIIRILRITIQFLGLGHNGPGKSTCFLCYFALLRDWSLCVVSSMFSCSLSRLMGQVRTISIGSINIQMHAQTNTHTHQN